MGQDTYIITENSGKLEVNGTKSDSVTFAGVNWRGIRSENYQAGSTIKYAKILETSNNPYYYDWFVKFEAATIENSRFSGSQYGPKIGNGSKITNSKVHNIRRTGMEIFSNSTATGNEFYDINTQESQNNHVYVNNSTFNLSLIHI